MLDTVFILHKEYGLASLPSYAQYLLHHVKCSQIFQLSTSSLQSVEHLPDPSSPCLHPVWLGQVIQMRPSERIVVHHFISSSLHHFISSPLYQFTTSSVHHFISSPLHQFTTLSVHHFISSPLYQFTTSSVHHFISSSLHHFSTRKWEARPTQVRLR